MTTELRPDLGDNFCYAPWTNIHINPLGEYKTCCAGDMRLGNLRTTDISEILNSPALADMKSAMIQNKYHENCRTCVEKEQHSGNSERFWYHDIAQRQVIPIASVQAAVPQNLDIRWSNTCNLSCVYCGSEASSVWANLKGMPLDKIDYGRNLQGMIDYVNQHRGTLKNIALLGGEPLLQKENESLLSVVPDDVHVNVITNLSVPLEKNKIFQRLINMNNVTWDISFETLDRKFEYVRRGASWNTMLQNIQILRNRTQDRPAVLGTNAGHRINITGQYCVYNCMNFAEVAQWFAENHLRIRWGEVSYPEILSVYKLPAELMQFCAEEIKKSLPHASNDVQRRLLTNQAENLRKHHNDCVSTQDLYDWHQRQEQLYWPNSDLHFAELWPEFS